MSVTKTIMYQIKTKNKLSADEVFSLMQAYLESKKSNLTCVEVKMDYDQNKSSKNQKFFDESNIQQIKRSIENGYFNLREINDQLKFPHPLDRFQNNIILENSEEEFDYKLNSKEYSRFPFINPSNDTFEKSQQFSLSIQGEVLGFDKIKWNEIEEFELENKDGKELEFSAFTQSFETVQAISLGTYTKNQQNYCFESLYNLGEKECSFIHFQQSGEKTFTIFLNFRSVGQVKVVLDNPIEYLHEQYLYLIATSTPQFFATTQTFHLINLIEDKKRWHSIHNILLTQPNISSYMKIYSADYFAIKFSLKEKVMKQTSMDYSFSQNLLTQYITNELSFQMQYMLLVLLSSKKISIFEIPKLQQLLQNMSQGKGIFFLKNLMNRQKQDEDISQFSNSEERQDLLDSQYHIVYKVVVSPSKFNFLLPSYEYNSYLIKELEIGLQETQNIVRIIFESNKSDFISSIYYRKILMSFNMLSKNFCYFGKQNNEALLIEVQTIDDQQNKDKMQQYNCELLKLLENVGDYSSIQELYEQQMTINQALSKSLFIQDIKKQKKIYDLDNQLLFGLIDDKVFQKILKFMKENLNIKSKDVNCLLLQINGCTSLFFPICLIKEDSILFQNKNYKYILPKQHCNHQSNKRNKLYLIDYNQLEKGWISKDILKMISNKFEIEHDQLFNDQDQIYKTINQVMPYDNILIHSTQKSFRNNYNYLLDKYNLSQDYFFIILKDILKNKIQTLTDINYKIYPKNCLRLYSFIDQLEELNEDEIFVQIELNNKFKTIEGPVLLINETDQQIIIKKLTAKSDLFNTDYYKQFKNTVVVCQQSSNLFNHRQKITLIYGDQLNDVKFKYQVIQKSQSKVYIDHMINIKKCTKIFLEQKQLIKESKEFGIVRPNIMTYFSQNQLFLQVFQYDIKEEMKDDIEQAKYETFKQALVHISKYSNIFSRFNSKYGLSSNYQVYSLLFENRDNTDIQLLQEFEDIIVNFADEVFTDSLDQKIKDKKQFYLNFDKNLIQSDADFTQFCLQLSSGLYYLCLLACLAYNQNQNFDEIAQRINEQFQFNIKQFQQQIQQTQVNEGLLGFFWIISVKQFI
ncbi:hypothetical protein ABPG72_006255 [Tetrahymena utriculariae]